MGLRLVEVMHYGGLYLDALDIDEKVAGDKERASKRKRNG